MFQHMFENLIEVLKANPRKIVYTEGTDARILESAARLKKDGFLTPVLVGNVEAVKAAAEKGGFDIEGLEILDPATYPGMDEMVKTMFELRKGKMTAWPDNDVLVFEKADDAEHYLILVNVRNEQKTVKIPEEWKKLGEALTLEPYEYCIEKY